MWIMVLAQLGKKESDKCAFEYGDWKMVRDLLKLPDGYKKNRQVELEPTKEDSLAYIKKYTDDVLSCGFPQKQGQK